MVAVDRNLHDRVLCVLDGRTPTRGLLTCYAEWSSVTFTTTPAFKNKPMMVKICI